MQDNFDWNDLKYFLALSRLKRMTAAGRALGIDQTTVARRIRALEKSVGALLFIRDEDGYALTQAGDRLMPIALEVERSSTRVHEQISGEAGRLAGTVRIGAPDGLGTFVATPLLARFQRDNPDVDMALVIRSRQFQMSHQEVHMSLDLTLPTSGRLLARRMTDYHLHFFASPDYLRRYAHRDALHDLLDDAGTAGLPAQAAQALGGLDALACCAGVFYKKGSDDTSLDEWRHTLDVNLTSSFVLSRAAIAHMRAQRVGDASVVVISSQIGHVGHARGAAYAASKAGVNGFIRNAALELAADQVRVNGVEPGMIATPAMDNLGDSQVNADIASRVPLGRLGAAQDIAGAMLFLASDLAAYITGQTIVVDGGSTLPEVK